VAHKFGFVVLVQGAVVVQNMLSSLIDGFNAALGSRS
jgi:hypothetical protein